MPELVGILALVSDDWAVAPQRRHQILSRLAARFPVAWISPALHWRERLPSRLALGGNGVASPRQMLILESRSGLPRIDHPPFVRRALYRRRVSRGARWLREQGCARIELQIWNPEFADATEWLPQASTSYHIDDEFSWATERQPMSAAERALIERV